MQSSLQERKQQFVRDAIWDAATDLFAEKGFDETTADEIARAAGVSRRSFFRYFPSKSDLMAHSMVNYGIVVTEAIEGCPASYSLSAVFRETVLQVARKSAAHPRTRKVMLIAEKYPAAREAQLARMSDVHDRIAEAYARRCAPGAAEEGLPSILAGLTLSVLGVTFRLWFEQGRQDITDTARQVFAALGQLVCDQPVPETTQPST